MAIESTADQAQQHSHDAAGLAVKAATPALIALSNLPLEIEIMTDLIFEDIGGQELINMSRNDIISGQDLMYSPIKNMQDLYLQYNSNNIIKLESSADTYFKNFTIKLEEKLPVGGTGPSGETIYLDSVTGDLVINLSFIEKDEQVEVQILNDGSIINDTIYGAG